MPHEKVAPHQAGPDRTSTCAKNNNRSEQKWRRVYWYLTEKQIQADKCERAWSLLGDTP
jgi:hypothetical protein